MFKSMKSQGTLDMNRWSSEIDGPDIGNQNGPYVQSMKLEILN